MNNPFAEFREPVFLKMEPSMLRENDKPINQVVHVVFEWERFGVKHLTLLSKGQGKCRFYP